MQYEVNLEVQVKKDLNEAQRDLLRETILKALDEADLPFGADVVTGIVRAF